MNLLRFMPERWHAVARELSRFGTVGVINLIVNFAVFNVLLLTLLRHGELKAKALATIVATTCAYVMNRHWTYRDRPKSTLHREYGLFFLFNLVGLVIEVSVVGAAKYGLHQTHIVVLNACTAIGILLGTIFRFWAYRTHVFKLAPEGPDGRAVVDARAVAGAVDAHRRVPSHPQPVVPATALNGSNGVAVSNGVAALAPTPAVHRPGQPVAAKPLAARTAYRDPGARRDLGAERAET